MKLIQKIINYFKLSRAELKKVIWPSKKTTVNHTIMVIAFSLGVAFFLGIVDQVLTFLFRFVIKA